jgi:hypothetical protein
LDQTVGISKVISKVIFTADCLNVFKH